MNIFVIEDDLDMQSALVDTLQKDHVVVAFSESEPALSAIDYNQPDLIILDLFTKSIHGIHFLERMREKPNGKNVRVIVLTNIDKFDSQIKIAELGVDHYLLKVTTSISDVQKLVNEMAGS